MAENYVTNEQLEKRLEDIKVEGLSHYIGKTLSEIAKVGLHLIEVSAVSSILLYGAMSFAYGPYDAGKVIYAELSGNKNLKHKHIETAKYLHSRRLQKPELDERDMKNLYIELGVVESEGKKPTEDDISWYNLLDWIEDQ
ncbi:MAG: hypothetical protein AABX83_02905 [Nanoarchaeota archaeon]